MICDKKRFNDFFEGFTVYDCAIGYDNSRYFFLLVEKSESPHLDPLPRTRFLFVRTERSIEERFYYQEFGNFDFTRVAFGETGGTPEFVAVDMAGHVFFYNGVEADEEQKGIIASWLNGERCASILNLKNINGDLYAVGNDRFIFSRKKKNLWEELPGLSRPKERETDGTTVFNFGFNDISAFSNSDMYAVGGTGDVWHFDGKHWYQISFPSNELLYTVCCAGDGNVYITGNMGSLWVGRKDHWEQLLSGNSSIPFKDSAWFANRLWCGSDYGLLVLQDGKLELPSDQPPEIRDACGVIDISLDGKLMLTASPYGAALYDGEKWELLFSSYAFAKKSPSSKKRR